MPRYEFSFKIVEHPEFGVINFYMDIENVRLEKLVREAKGDFGTALKQLAADYLKAIHKAEVEVVNYRKVS